MKQDGTILGLRVNMVSDNGAFFADAQPSKFRAGLFHVVTGSYDYPAAHIVTQGAYTNKAPGGVAYRCSFRITEASYLIERLVQNAAYELDMDPAEFRMKNFIKPEQFPYHTPTGFVYDSGDYAARAAEGARRRRLRRLREGAGGGAQGGQAPRRRDRQLHRGCRRRPGKDYDIAGLKMFDSAELRVHPTGKAILKLGTKSQGQGHETTYAQIVANELGIPASDIAVREGDTDNTPYGLGTYASRAAPRSAGAAAVVIARKLREKARKIAAHMLEASEDDLEWEPGRFFVTGVARSVVSRSRTSLSPPTRTTRGHRARPRGRPLLRPAQPDLPVRELRGRGRGRRGDRSWKVRRMVAVDDCGVRINPMIVEGQIRGGLAEGFAMSSMQFMTFDEDGNCIGSNLMDYLIPTAWETPRFELDETVTPSPHHPIGAKGVGESATVGSPAAYVNAVIDALSPYGIRNIDMPVLRPRCGRRYRRRRRGKGNDHPGVLELAGDLGERGRAFVLATVVWRRSPTSGKQGSKALILPDGTMRGWLCGACAEPTVRREALSSLDDGRTRLLLLGLPVEAAAAFGEGVVVVPMECGSEGALAVSLEPVVPTPLVVADRSVARSRHADLAHACARLARGRRRVFRGFGQPAGGSRNSGRCGDPRT